ncbi:MAG TPA: ATP-dependent 6-phosphofructokinase [Candidatus Saccharimonadales bacterium]|nr:ATP-dependent 6-phosphofructokinase [Candidatus Saccharimonadales bacterium]
MKKVGIITGGGDCAGLNAVIAAIVKAGSRMGFEFIGFERGWEGLLEPMHYQKLGLSEVRGISHLGGTILRTSNHGRFGAKVGAGDKSQIDPDVLKQAKANYDKLGLDALIVIGGDGSLSGAMQLADYGVNIVGVPKTIDNDLSSTDKTFGFSTAVQIATDAFDKVHTTATSHDRVIFVECMGRGAGWITLYAGISGSANAILLPEFELDIPELVGYLKNRLLQRHRRSAIVAVSEGIKFDQRTYRDIGASELSFAGASEQLMRAVEAEAPDLFEMRNVILGHTQRGGSPNAEDRMLSKRYGVEAIEAVKQGKFGQMVCIKDNVMQTVPILEAVGELNLVERNCYEYQTAQRMGIYIN